MRWSKTSSVVESTHHDEDPGQASFPAFAPITSDAFEHLKDLPDGMHLSAGTLLVEQGASCEAVWLIRKGLVRLTFVTPEGKETTLGLRTSGWFAGAANVIMNSPSVVSVKTMTPCVVSRIPAGEFPLRLMQSARLMRHFVTTLSSELLSQSSAQARLMSESAEQRLATFMRERRGSNQHIRTMDTLPMLKQMELAQLLSITPEHLSRLLHKSSGTVQDNGDRNMTA